MHKLALNAFRFFHYICLRNGRFSSSWVWFFRMHSPKRSEDLQFFNHVDLLHQNYIVVVFLFWKLYNRKWTPPLCILTGHAELKHQPLTPVKIFKPILIFSTSQSMIEYVAVLKLSRKAASIHFLYPLNPIHTTTQPRKAAVLLNSIQRLAHVVNSNTVTVCRV